MNGSPGQDAQVFSLTARISETRPIEKLIVLVLIEAEESNVDFSGSDFTGILIFKCMSDIRLPSFRVRDPREFNLSNEELGKKAIEIFAYGKAFNLPIQEVRYLRQFYLARQAKLLKLFSAKSSIDPHDYVKKNRDKFTLIPRDMHCIKDKGISRLNPVDKQIILDHLAFVNKENKGEKTTATVTRIARTGT